MVIRKLSQALILVLSVAALMIMGGSVATAQKPPPPYLKKGMITPADRQAAAVNRAKALAAKGQKSQVNTRMAPRRSATALATPDYFGNIPNYANSPLPPSVTIVGDGVGAVATVTVSGGGVTAFTVVAPGSGYTLAATTVSVIGGGGTGGLGTPTIDPVTGGITAIAVSNAGIGYGTVPGLRKFVDALPGLYVTGGSLVTNDLGQYIPVGVPDVASYPGSDYYEIELGEYTEQMHKDLPATKLRGYRQTNTSDANISKFSYLGPIILAQKDRPVRVKFTNSLPTGAGGDLFIPTDTTYMGAGEGPKTAAGGACDPTTQVCANYTQNRATLHLHGGNTPWISDGTPHQWTTPATENTPYPKGVSVQNVPDMPAAGPGQLTFFYTNQQSARLLFYHDHAYGITRLNVYAGEAAGYIISDAAEQSLLSANVIPTDQIPLIIQDKTFVPGATQLAAQDPTWDAAKYGGYGNLWFPHVYMTNQNPYDMSGANAMGRWDYGPWFWPPFTGITNGEIANPLCNPTCPPGEPPYIPGTPNPSGVPEGFMDTPVINGTAYPYLQVGQKAYRFRILNASNDRMLNLQLYKAKSNATMWDATTGTLVDANAGEVNMVPAVPGAGLPAAWPTDGRDGGVPDPAARGPKFIQIGTEAGLLPAPYVIENVPVGYDYNRRSITVLNVLNKSLFLGPAERADVIVDFSGVPDGSKLILYNDAPAPVPAFDPRNDYYTGSPDNTPTGGAPSTLPGYGPNTRTLMQIQVSTALGTASTYNLGALQTALPVAYAQGQPKPIVPGAPYNAAFGQSGPADYYSRIQDTSKTMFNGALAGLKLTNGGTGYTSVPTVNITGGGGSGATATATVASPIGSVALGVGGSGYTSPPTIGFAGGGGTGAAATATLASTSVAGISVTNGGVASYIAPPTVTITGGGGSGATAVAIVRNRRIAMITVTNPGSGYTSPPTVTITGGGGSGATAVARMAPTSVASLTLTAPGSGYTSIPTVTFTGGGGTGATGTATLGPGAVVSLTLTSGGTGYTSAPTIGFSGGGGSGATATAVGTTMALQPKSIIENFTQDYGRMNAILGVEVPNTTGMNQTSIPYGYIDPPTEIIRISDSAAPIGSLADGTQIWKITHNGVDTHALHYHLFDVQVINRIGWDGAVKPPDANEVGWKDTVRMNPLEDIVVALRPMGQTLPWQIPNSVRLLDPTMPQGTTMQFGNQTAGGVDPTNQPVTITNLPTNLGWEYVWHCHLLGHEENDMMRVMAFAVPPVAPSNAAAARTGSGNTQRVTVTWRDNSINETGFWVQRATSPTGPWTNVNKTAVAAGTGMGTTISFTDTSPTRQTTLYYRVIASNLVGYTQAYAAPAVGFPTISADSTPSTVSNAVTTN